MPVIRLVATSLRCERSSYRTMASNTPSLARIAVRNTVWVSLGTYLNQIIGFMATLAMTRILSPEVFGFFAMGIFWSTLLNLRPKSGLNYAAIQQTKTAGDLLGTYYVLDAIAATGSLALSVIAAIVLSQLGYRQEVALAIVILMSADSFSALVSPLSMVLEKELQLSRLTLVSLLASSAAYVIAISLALAGGGIWSLLAINSVTTLISLGGVYWVCRRRWPQAFHFRWRFNSTLAKQLLRLGIPTGLSLTALSSIVTQLDNFLIGTFVGYATLGFYDRAYRIAHWPNILLTMVVTRIGFLTFAKVQNDLPRLTHAMRLSLWILTTLGMPITLVLFFGAPDIVRILYGPAWNESGFFLRFLTIYSFVWPFVSLGFWLSIALGHTRTTMLLTASQAVALIVIATPLTWQWGAMGTILGVGITMALGFTLSCYYMFRQVPLSIGATFGPPLLAMSVAASIVFALCQLPNWEHLPPLTHLFAIGLLGPGTFVVCLFALRRSEMMAYARYLRQAWHKSAK